MSSSGEIAGTANASGGMTLRDLCCLFCCPPCPSNIVSKLAFMPPSPSYRIVANQTSESYGLELIEGKAEWPYGRTEFEAVDAYITRSRRGNKVACIHISCCPNAKFTLLFSHGNAVDLGQMCSFYYGLGVRLQCNVFSYDYSGYGCSTGKATEKNLYADITAAWNVLTTKYNVAPDKVIIYGQSIGTVPSVDLAVREPVAGLVLHSPLMSGMRVAFPETNRTWCFDAFPSIEKMPRVLCPTLVIHGTADDVIDFSHGLAIFEKCPKAVEPLWVEEAGHNDVELHPVYLERLKKFIEKDVQHKSDVTPGETVTKQWPATGNTTGTRNKNEDSSSKSTDSRKDK